MPRQIQPIDDDIYEFLQGQSVPLEDDINSVLRRLLGLDKARGGQFSEQARESSAAATRRLGARKSGMRRKEGRATKGSLLPEHEYELPILQALVDLGGRGPTREVINRVGDLLDGRLTPVDRALISSGDVRWRNRAQFVRLGLIKKGEMKPDSPKGIWDISESGVQRLKEASK